METSKKTCLYCQAPLAGRQDKKFCSNQCRANFSNARKQTDRGEIMIRELNMVLRQNRSILRRASPLGKTTLRRQVLELGGFNFNYFTHLYRTKQGHTYYFCYDYGYLLLPEEDKVLIVNWQPYMQQSL